MKKLNYYNGQYGQIFFTDGGWSYIHENDGEIRKEFFEGVFSLVSAELNEIGTFSELPKYIQEAICESEYEEPEAYD